MNVEELPWITKADVVVTILVVIVIATYLAGIGVAHLARRPRRGLKRR
jgi:hypothetical protein